MSQPCVVCQLDQRIWTACETVGCGNYGRRVCVDCQDRATVMPEVRQTQTFTERERTHPSQSANDQLFFCKTCKQMLTVSIEGDDSEPNTTRSFSVECLSCGSKSSAQEFSSSCAANANDPDTTNVVVMFVAHDGVHHPAIWQHWAGAHNVVFRVLCNAKPTVHPKFCDKFRIVGDHANSEGGANTLRWMLQGIRWICRRTSFKYLIILPGDAIPVKSFELLQNRLLHQDASTAMCHHLFQDYHNEHFELGLFGLIKVSTSLVSHCAAQSEFHSHFASEAAWIIWRGHAFFTGLFDYPSTLFKSLRGHTDSVIEFRVYHEPNDRLRCDSFFFGMIFMHSDLNMISADICARMQFGLEHERRYRSVKFVHADEEISALLDGRRRTLTARQLITHVEDNEDVFFLRKIWHSCHLEGSLTF